MPQCESVHDQKHRRHVQTEIKNEEAEMPKRHNKDGSVLKYFRIMA